MLFTAINCAGGDTLEIEIEIEIGIKSLLC
jgi:hypothetical protein